MEKKHWVVNFLAGIEVVTNLAIIAVVMVILYGIALGSVDYVCALANNMAN